VVWLSAPQAVGYTNPARAADVSREGASMEAEVAQ